MKRAGPWLEEAAVRTPVRGRYDVVVAGAGVAGVAAAVAAAREGASVCLLEKECAPGGLATLGLVVVYLPLCDGLGNLVAAGLAEEMLLLATRDGSAAPPECWLPGGDPRERARARYRLTFNPASYLLALESFLLEAGVELFYDTRVVGARVRSGRVEAVLTESKAGRLAFACRAAVDATGDADLCFQAGERTVSLGTNSASGWYYTFTPGTGAVGLHKLYRPFDRSGEKVLPDTGRGFYGDRPEEVTAQLLESRRMIREHLGKFRAESSDPSIVPLLVPVLPCLRMTRRLEGARVVSRPAAAAPDTVGLVPDWRRPGPVYALPLGALSGVTCRNLFAAGRCLSSRGEAWDALRSIPGCVVSGQAAGVSAALAGRSEEPVRAREIRRRLRAAGMILARPGVPARGR